MQLNGIKEEIILFDPVSLKLHWLLLNGTEMGLQANIVIESGKNMAFLPVLRLLTLWNQILKILKPTK